MNIIFQLKKKKNQKKNHIYYLNARMQGISTLNSLCRRLKTALCLFGVPAFDPTG